MTNRTAPEEADMTTATEYQHHDRDASAGTRRAYEYAWRRYLRWCEAEGREPWNDPDGETFAAFTAAMVRAGLKATTLRQCRAAIVYRYRTDPALYKLADPTKTDTARAEMKAIARRDRGRRPNKALPMTPDVRERVLRVSALRRSGETADKARLRHAEAEAVLRLMFDAALRCDDMVRAEWGHLDTDPAANGHRSIYVPPGKTGHDRHGSVSAPTWAALQRWRAVTPDPDGRISTASTAQAIGERIRRLGVVAGVPLSGHSPRRGVATTLAQAGATEQELRAVGGWRSPAMVSEYCDAPHAASNAVSRLYQHEPPAADHAEPTETADLALARAQGAVMLAAALSRRFGGVADDPAVMAAQELVFELWPLDDPPPRCERPGCPGLLLAVERRPTDRWCSTACRTRKR